MRQPLINVSPDGLYCPIGQFHIDPWNPVPRAVITHAHADHARSGSEHYLTAAAGRIVLSTRLGPDAKISAISYGEVIDYNSVRLSLHPAGHVLGSAQVRVEHDGEVWVVSGDYKLAGDPTCETFEPVKCHTFITESTFGLPVYRWPETDELVTSINNWWQKNKDLGKTSMLFAYSLGKAQRLLSSIDSTIGPIFTHGAVERMTQAYRQSGVTLPATIPVVEAIQTRNKPWIGGLVIAPPSADGSVWTKRFAPLSTAHASGWMAVRGARRRRAADRGFALSDHADWPGLLDAIQQTGASRVYATHGFASILAHWLRDQGVEAGVLSTRFGDEDDAPPIEVIAS